MAINQSFSGSIPNPIVDARLKMALSGQALAKRLGLSRQYLSRAERGTYSSLNPSLIRWVANAESISSGAVVLRYAQFQKAHRLETLETVQPAQLIRLGENGAPGNEIFKHWRESYWPSHMGFANAFCVHPDSVLKYEDGIQKTMPKTIRDSLAEVNLIEPNWSEFKPQTTSPHKPA